MTGREDHAALREAAAEVLRSHGLVLEELVVRGGGPSRTPEIRLVVDLPEDRLGSADLDTVSSASAELGRLIDEDESLLGPDPVLLEITTPGTDRPLTALRHFRRSRGRLLEIETVEGERYRARLLEVQDPEQLVLRQEPGRDDRGRPRTLPAGTVERLVLPISRIAGARVRIEFDPPDDLAELIAGTENTASKES